MLTSEVSPNDLKGFVRMLLDSSDGAPASKTVVLVRVPEDLFSGVQELFTQYESSGIGCLAAYLREHRHKVVVLDGTMIDISEELSARIRPEFKALLADLQISAMAKSAYGIPDSSDMSWQVRKVYMAQEILDRKPDLVGFSLISNLVCQRVAEMIALLRQLDIQSVICVGGEQASLYAHDVMTRMPGLDACVRAEGEETLDELVTRLSDRTCWHEIRGLTWRDGSSIIDNPKRPLIRDLDSLPLPARDTLADVLSRGGDAIVVGSRGCAYRCGFCSVVEFYQAEPNERWRARSPEGIVQEIVQINRDFGADRFWFVDDEFFGAGEAARIRANRVFALLESQQLPIRFDIFCRANDIVDTSGDARHSVDFDVAVRAGLRRVFIGIESGSEGVLREHFCKGVTPEINLQAINSAERQGIDVLVEFIMFDPWVDLADIDDNLKLLKSAAWGRYGETGKFSPPSLSSRLYIHRETPLGRQFLADSADLLKSGASADDFILDYRFKCARTGALCHIIENSWQGFSPALQALEQLYRVVDRYWLPDGTARGDADKVRQLHEKYAAGLHELERVLNLEALSFFEEALDFVRSFNLDWESAEQKMEMEAQFSDEIYGRTRKMAFEVENVSTYVYSLAVNEIEEAWGNAKVHDLLGEWKRPPSVLSREELDGNAATS